MTGTGRTVGIVGLGLIGGSLAQALVARGVAVVATTRAASTRRAAAEAGVAVVEEVAEVVGEADLVVLATPLSAMADHLARVGAALPEGPQAPTVTDVGSVKGPLAVSSLSLGDPSVFVGGHPMAGTEAVGWPAADPHLFEGRRWAVAVDPPVALGRWAEVADLAIAAGSEVVPVEAAAHDQAVALVSHLPYAVAALAAGRLVDDGVAGLARSLAAGSFGDLTRVAGGHPSLGAEMATANAPALRPQLEALADDLRALAAALDARADDVAAVFASGRAGRDALDEARRAVLVPTEASMGRTDLVALGRRGGRVVAVAPAAPDVERLDVVVLDPGGSGG